MLNIKRAAQSDAETVAHIICQSFKRQVQLLELTPESCPTYVAFETAVGVSTLPFELLFLAKQLTKSPPNASAS